MKTFEIESLPIYAKDKQILSLTSKIGKVNEKTAKMVIETSLREHELELQLSILEGRRAALLREMKRLRSETCTSEENIEQWNADILCEMVAEMTEQAFTISIKMSNLHAEMYEKHIGQYETEFEGD